VQGAEQGLHVLSELSPYSPFGQTLMHEVPLKNVVTEHPVQVVAEVEHLTQGKVQLLQE
jgi:hypothetical protein